MTEFYKDYWYPLTMLNVETMPNAEEIKVGIKQGKEVARKCGWKGISLGSGWTIRRDVLQETQSQDKRFLGLLKQEEIDFKVADIRDLLRYIGVPETVIANPEPAAKIERFEGPNGEVTLLDPYGGAYIITGSAIHSRRWDGPSDLVMREIELMEQKKNMDGTGK